MTDNQKTKTKKIDLSGPLRDCYKTCITRCNIVYVCGLLPTRHNHNEPHFMGQDLLRHMRAQLEMPIACSIHQIIARPVLGAFLSRWQSLLRGFIGRVYKHSQQALVVSSQSDSHCAANPTFAHRTAPYFENLC